MPTRLEEYGEGLWDFRATVYCVPLSRAQNDPAESSGMLQFGKNTVLWACFHNTTLLV